MNGTPDLTPTIRGWCSDAGFSEVAWAPVPDSLATGRVARLAAPPRAFWPDTQLSFFVDRLEG